MAEDRVTITADATGYFDVLRRAGTAAESFSRTGTRIGDGFLKGERVVESATRNITQGLLSAQSVGEATALTMEGLVRVLRLPLGVGIGAVAGVTAIARVRDELDKTQAAVDAFQKAISTPLRIAIDLAPADITAKLDAASDATEALDKRVHGIFETARRFADIGLGDAPKTQEDVNRGIEEQNRLAQLLVAAEQKVTAVKAVELRGDKESLALAQSKLQFETARAQALDLARTHPAQAAAISGVVDDLQKQKDIRDELIKQQAKSVEIERKLADTESDIAAGLALAKSVPGADTALLDARSQLIAANAKLDAAKKEVPLARDKAAAESAATRALNDQIIAQLKLNELQKARPVDQFAPTLTEQLRQQEPQAPLPFSAAGPFQGESQALIDQIEKNRVDFEALSQTVDQSQAAMDQFNAGADAAGATLKETLNPDDLIRMGEGLQKLSQLDELSFDDLRTLAAYDFSNLQVLADLNLTIQ